MQGLRRSSDNRQPSDSLAQLTLNKRGVQLVGSEEPGAKKSAAGRAAKTAQSATAATRAAATTAHGVASATAAVSGARDSSEQAADRSRDVFARAAQNVGGQAARGTATLVRGGAKASARAVKGGIVAAQKRVAAVNAAQSANSVVAGTASVSRGAAAVARAGVAAAAAIKSIIAATVAAVSSTPLLAIVAGVLVALAALLSMFTMTITTSAPEPTPTVPTSVSADGWTQPAAGPITSGYGMRRDPVTGSFTKLHAATDFSGGGEGAPIWAAQAGTVTQATNQVDPNGAWLIEITHGSGITTRYWHMWADGVLVNVGDQVTAGQQIGEIGSSGWSTGPHLHFQVLVDGAPVDPEVFMAEQGLTLQ